MALVSLTCPQCGAALELEENDKDYGFCPFCGTKVQLHEVISVKHSGTVTLDNSAQAINRLQIANRAFESHNFTEASSYYTKVLEDFPGNYAAIYRKGICAIYLAAAGSLPTAEYQVAMKAAAEALATTEQPNGKSQVDLIAVKDRDLLELLNSCVLAFDGNQPLQPSLDSCNALFAKLASCAAFAATVIGNIDTEVIREQALAKAIEFCSGSEKLKLKYHAGTTIEKNGNVRENIESCRISGQNKALLAQTKKTLSDIYNSLPSRLERESNLYASIKVLGDNIRELEKQIASEKKTLKASKAAFWEANPDLKKGRSKAMLPALIIGILFVIATVIFIFCIPWVGYLISPVGILLAILLASGSVRKYDSNVFSEDIKQQIAVLNDDLKELKEKKENLAAENDQLKEFNRSRK